MKKTKMSVAALVLLLARVIPPNVRINRFIQRRVFMKRKIKSVLAGSCRSVLALLLVLALQLSWVTRNLGAQERLDDQRTARQNHGPGDGSTNRFGELSVHSLDLGRVRLFSAPHVEQDNRDTVAGGIITLFDRQPGPDITRTCVFNRSAGDPTEYSANVSASADATFLGASGGYGHYFVDLGPVDVTTCP